MPCRPISRFGQLVWSTGLRESVGVVGCLRGDGIAHPERHEVVMLDQRLLPGEVVYRRSLPLATQHLRIVASRTKGRAGVLGASAMAVEHVLSPAAIEALIP